MATEFDVLKELARMVQVREHGSCGIYCGDCPISDRNNGTSISCGHFMRMYPEKATEIIRKWSEEHPKKTRGDLIREHFPDARLDSLSPCFFFGNDLESKVCSRFENCPECMELFWNEVVE